MKPLLGTLSSINPGHTISPACTHTYKPAVICRYVSILLSQIKRWDKINRNQLATQSDTVKNKKKRPRNAHLHARLSTAADCSFAASPTCSCTHCCCFPLWYSRTEVYQSTYLEEVYNSSWRSWRRRKSSASRRLRLHLLFSLCQATPGWVKNNFTSSCWVVHGIKG